MINRYIAEDSKWAIDFLMGRAWQYQIKISWIIAALAAYVLKLGSDKPFIFSCIDILYWIALTLSMVCVLVSGYTLYGAKVLQSPARVIAKKAKKGLSIELDLMKGEKSVLISADLYLKKCGKGFNTVLIIAGIAFMSGIIWYLFN